MKPTILATMFLALCLLSGGCVSTVHNKVDIEWNIFLLSDKDLAQQAKAKLDGCRIEDIEEYVYGLVKNREYQLAKTGIIYISRRHKKALLPRIAKEGLLCDDDLFRAYNARGLGAFVQFSNKLPPEYIDLLRACLHDKSLIVRYEAAGTLLGIVPTRLLMPVLMEGLGSFEKHPLDNMPMPISCRTKSMLKGSRFPKQDRELLKQFYHTTDNEIIKYQILDILAYLNGKIQFPIYSYYSPPREEDKEKLDKFKYLIEITRQEPKQHSTKGFDTWLGPQKELSWASGIPSDEKKKAIFSNYNISLEVIKGSDFKLPKTKNATVTLGKSGLQGIKDFKVEPNAKYLFGKLQWKKSQMNWRFYIFTVRVKNGALKGAVVHLRDGKFQKSFADPCFAVYKIPEQIKVAPGPVSFEIIGILAK